MYFDTCSINTHTTVQDSCFKSFCGQVFTTSLFFAAGINRHIQFLCVVKVALRKVCQEVKL